MQSGEISSDQNSNAREEVTGEVTTENPSTGSLVITGQANVDNQIVTGTTTVSTGTAVSADIAKLIQARASKPKDDKKLTEDDIDLIDQVVQKVESIGK